MSDDTLAQCIATSLCAGKFLIECHHRFEPQRSTKTQSTVTAEQALPCALYILTAHLQLYLISSGCSTDTAIKALTSTVFGRSKRKNPMTNGCDTTAICRKTCSGQPVLQWTPTALQSDSHSTVNQCNSPHRNPQWTAQKCSAIWSHPPHPLIIIASHSASSHYTT